MARPKNTITADTTHDTNATENSLSVNDNSPKKGIAIPQYQIMVDHILVGSIDPNGAVYTLSGKVTKADLIEAGCDFEWLMKSGQIKEDGYVFIEQ